MNRMLLIATAAAMLLCSADECIARDPHTQPWFVDRCAQYSTGHCRMPFQVALTSAGEISSKNLRLLLRGFLVRELDGFALYENREAATLGWRTDAILITKSSSLEFLKSLERWNLSLVEVRGELALVVSESNEYWVQFKLDSPVIVTGIRGEKLERSR